MTVADIARKIAAKIRNAVYGREIRDLLAQIAELSGEQVDRVDALLKGNPQPSEIVDARQGFQLLLYNLMDKDSAIAKKADRLYVDQVMANMTDGSPKDIFYSLEALLTMYPNGANGPILVYDSSHMDGAHAYIWDGEEWEDLGLYNGVVIADNSISEELTTFLTIGSKNLFNKNRVTYGKYVYGSTGQLLDSDQYYASSYIPVQPGKTYFKPDNLPHFAWSDTNKKYISGGVNGVSQQIITAPANARFIRVSVPASDLNTYMLNEGTGAIPFEQFGYKFADKNTLKYSFNDLDDNVFPGSAMKPGSLNGEKVEENSLTPELMTFMNGSVNLYNNDKASDKALDISTGLTIDSTNQRVSYFIPVTAKDVINFSHNVARYAYYDRKRNLISGFQPNPAVKQITVPDSTLIAYIRVDFYRPNAAQFMAVKGTLPSQYVPYKQTMSKEYLPEPEVKKQDFFAFLPNNIYIAAGRTIELYNRQVAWCGNINNFHFKWSCQQGKAMKRKFSMYGDPNNLGSFPLTLTVYDNNMQQIWSKTTQLQVVNNQLAREIKVLALGDSLTNDKFWLEELRRLSEDKITFVGTRGTAPLNHEGRSGFQAKYYLEPKEYPFGNEGVHPFWDPELGRFSWYYYKTKTGINPDVIQIFLGTNGLAVDPTENANAIKQIIDYIRQDDPNIPIYLVNTLYKGDQDGIGVQRNSDGYAANQGQWKLQEDRKVFNLMVRLDELLGSYSNLHFIPVALMHDSEYNYGAVETPVNPRAIQTEPQPTEAVHPQKQGHEQIADSMIGVYAAKVS